jgi:hypothetical protein
MKLRIPVIQTNGSLGAVALEDSSSYQLNFIEFTRSESR